MTWNWAWKTTALWNLQLSTLSMSWVSIMGWPPSLGATGSSILVSHQQLWCILMTFPNSNWKWNRQWVISKIEESKEQRPEIEPLKPPLPYENPSSVGITLILVTTPILALHLAWQMGLQCPPGSRRWFLLQVTVIILKHNVNWVACDGTLFSHWFGTSSCPLSLRYRLLKFGVFFTWGAVLGLGLWCTLGGGYGFFLAVIILKLTVDCFACIGVLFSSWFGSTVGQPLSLWCSIFNVSICSSCGVFWGQLPRIGTRIGAGHFLGTLFHMFCSWEIFVTQVFNIRLHGFLRLPWFCTRAGTHVVSIRISGRFFWPWIVGHSVASCVIFTSRTMMLFSGPCKILFHHIGNHPVMWKMICREVWKWLPNLLNILIH